MGGGLRDRGPHLVLQLQASQEDLVPRRYLHRWYHWVAHRCHQEYSHRHLFRRHHQRVQEGSHPGQVAQRPNLQLRVILVVT